MTERSVSARSVQIAKLWWRAAPSAVAAVAILGATADLGFAQSGRKWFGPKSAPAVPQPAPPQNGFAATIERLLTDARRQAAAGQIEESIKTAQRARKIAEASSAVLRDNPAVSTAAADQLLRELSALRGEAAPLVVATATTAPASRPVTAEPQSTGVAAFVARPAAIQVRPNAVAAAIPELQPVAPVDEQESPPTIAAARTPALDPQLTSGILASSRSSTSGYAGAGGFSILGSETRAAHDSIHEPASESPLINESLPTIEVVLGPAEWLPPVATGFADEPGAAVVEHRPVAPPVVVRAFRPTVIESKETSESFAAEPVILGRAAMFPLAPPTPEAAALVRPVAADVMESFEDDRVTVWANRAASSMISESAADMLTSPAPVNAFVVPPGSEPQLAAPTEWNSTAPGNRTPRATAKLDTAWESANQRATPSTPAPQPSASVTPNAGAASISIMPLPEVVTPVGFTQQSATKPVAPPPPREIDATSAIDLDTAEHLSEPAARVRETAPVTTPSAAKPQWSASVVDQLARQWKLPAQTITAGLAAMGLVLLGVGLTLVRLATRRTS